MGQVDLVGAPGRGRIRPLLPFVGRLQPAAEKGQLKSEAAVVAVGQIAGVIPPFGAVILMGTMIGGKGELAGSGDLQKSVVRRDRPKSGSRDQNRGPDTDAEMPACSNFVAFLDSRKC
jgi:hypothetical protein